MTVINFRKGRCESLMRAVTENEVELVGMKPFIWFDYGVPITAICGREAVSHNLRGVTPAQAALRWVLDQDEVSTTVPAVNAIEELVDNLGVVDLSSEHAPADFLQACADIPDFYLRLVDLVDHEHEELRRHARRSLIDHVGEDFGDNKEAYRAALKVMA